MSTSTITEAECTKIHMIKISQQYCLVTAKDRKHIKNACFKHLLKKKKDKKQKYLDLHQLSFSYMQGRCMGLVLPSSLPRQDYHFF